MEYYIVNFDFNRKQLEYYNIFDNKVFCEELNLLHDKWIEDCQLESFSYEEFKSNIDNVLKYCFWSKCEYEILVKDLFDIIKENKIDGYYQIKPNIDILCNYILNKWKHI